MRKLMIMLVMTVLASSLAFAATHGPDGAPTDGVMNDTMNDTMPDETMMDDNDTRGPPADVSTRSDETREAMNGSGPLAERNGAVVHRGLDQAMSNVENEQARQALQRNMDRFLQRHRERLMSAENVTVEVEEDGSATVRAREEVRYLGFIKGKATHRFDIAPNGNVNERAPWYRFLYSEADRSEDAGDANETEE